MTRVPQHHDDDDADFEDDPEAPDPSDQDASDEPDLEVCPHCRKMISEEAEQCPHCGEYVSLREAPMTPMGWVVTAIIIALLASLLLF